MTNDKKAVQSSVQSNTGTGAGSASNTVAPTRTSALPATGFELQLQMMMQGFQNYVPAGFTFPSKSGGYTQANVVSQFQQLLALYTAVAPARAAYSEAVKQREAAIPSARSLYQAVKAAVVAYYGKGSPDLVSFGITDKLASERTPIEKAVAVAKARQTRAANGTLGKKQKAKIALARELQAVASTLVPQGPQVSPPAGTPAAVPAVKPPVSG